MRLSISLAEKLKQLLEEKSLPASQLKGEIVQQMLHDGVLQKRLLGRSKAIVFIPDESVLRAYLANQLGVSHLESYIAAYYNEALTRGEAIEVSGDSKMKPVRTFSGFLVNSYSPINAKLNGTDIVIQPAAGSLMFISDWKNFVPHPSVTIVGIENPENFSRVHQMQYLFEDIHPLFICRYPQNNDALHWLESIPNKYLHFGDLDFAGMNIYLYEYKKRLGNRASFLVPSNLDALISKYGNRELYNRQLHLVTASALPEPGLTELTQLLHRHSKVLEQEVFLRRD